MSSENHIEDEVRDEMMQLMPGYALDGLHCISEIPDAGLFEEIEKAARENLGLT